MRAVLSPLQPSELNSGAAPGSAAAKEPVVTQDPITDGGNEPPVVPRSDVANPARVWNYWVGGRYHSAVDLNGSPGA
jgi:hypothetical protein